VELFDALSCTSLQCRRRGSRAWRRGAALCEVGVGELCVGGRRRGRGGGGCGRRLPVAFAADCCDTRRSISTSERGVLRRRRSILNRSGSRRQPCWQADGRRRADHGQLVDEGTKEFAPQVRT